MDWPARSPDLNPIEHVWDALGRRIRARHPSPRTLVELRTALLEEWGLLPLDLLQSLDTLDSLIPLDQNHYTQIGCRRPTYMAPVKKTAIDPITQTSKLVILWKLSYVDFGIAQG
ncbi:hypothetical protein LAZ67_16002320, partial [Cordylochernes scorpioides]